MQPPPIEPDTKDWTWVLERTCPECGFDPDLVHRDGLPDALRASAKAWPTRLAEPDAAIRSAQDAWSPVEYACHVRDVHLLFDERVGRMLAEDDPGFADWDQDRTAVDSRYGEQDPATVARELVEAAEAVARRYDAVVGDQWERSGRRSDGSVFTVGSLGAYHLHDVVHHAWDVGS